MKFNDTVRVLKYEEDSINAYARVEKVRGEYVWVSNMNMPYQGTLAMEPFPKKEVRLVRQR